MRIEHDYHLTLERSDLLPELRETPPARLRPEYFTHEARVAAWYATAGVPRYSVVYVDASGPDGTVTTLEVMTNQFREGPP